MIIDGSINVDQSIVGLENPLSITKIFWINLIIDCLATMAFGGEAALLRYMDETPKRRDEPIISLYMYSAISTGALWTFTMRLMFLLTDFSSSHFRDNVFLMTGYICLFVLMATANAFNARTTEINIFGHISENPSFLKVMLLIIVVQVAMAYLDGAEKKEDRGLAT